MVFSISVLLALASHLAINNCPLSDTVFTSIAGMCILLLLLFDNFMGYYLSQMVIRRIKELVPGSSLLLEKPLLISANIGILLFGWFTTYSISFLLVRLMVILVNVDIIKMTFLYTLYSDLYA